MGDSLIFIYERADVIADLAGRIRASKVVANGGSAKTRQSGSAAFDVLVSYLSSKKSQNAGRRDISRYNIDESDLEIIKHMLAGYAGADIARKTGMPLTTIQRRSRRLLQERFVVPVAHLNYRKFGLRRGLLYLKCKNTNLEDAVVRISRIKGIESAGAYLGSLNVIANVVYADSKEVLGIIAAIQKMDLMDEVTWLEEIYSMPV